MELRTCVKCGKQKPADQFRKHWRNCCKECYNSRQLSTYDPVKSRLKYLPHRIQTLEKAIEKKEEQIRILQIEIDEMETRIEKFEEELTR